MCIANLKRAREKKKLTQAQMAALLGITSTAYQHYEYGKREPSNDMLVRIADILDVSTDYLLGRAKPEKRPAETDPLAGVDVPMSETERKILTIYLSLSEGTRKDLMDFLRSANKELSEPQGTHSGIYAETKISDLKASNEAALKDVKKLG